MILIILNNPNSLNNPNIHVIDHGAWVPKYGRLMKERLDIYVNVPSAVPRLALITLIALITDISHEYLYSYL